jgi:hypothetical protein
MGGTPQGKDANTALRALSRAARAFSLYDSKNVIIRRFLQEYRESMDAALKAHGELTFTVRPWELLLGAEVVYKDLDRERSLAFRLFRDGVRKLVIRPGLGWEECVRLLEILSVRFSGVRQQEDDIVTLLRKASFEKIGFTAAEGFTPGEDNPEPALPEADPARKITASAPPDFDLPLPANEPSANFVWREVPLPYLEGLRSEEGPATVPHHAVRLVNELLVAANGPASELSNAELVPLITEVRDYCIADGASAALLQLVRSIKSQHGIGIEQLTPLIEGIGQTEALSHLLDCIPHELTVAPDQLVALLQEVPGTHVGAIVERLNATAEPTVQGVLKDLMGKLASKDASSLVEQLHHSDRKAASQIVAVLMATAPDQALATAMQLADSPDPASHLEALEILQAAPISDTLSNLLVKFAGSHDDAVFARTAQVMATRHERRGFDTLAKQAEARAHAGTLTRESSTALGESLAALSPSTALALLKQWAHLKAGLLGRLSPHHKWLQMTGVAGLALLKDPEIDTLLRELHKDSHDEDVKRQCTAAAAKRRKPAGGPAHG